MFRSFAETTTQEAVSNASIDVVATRRDPWTCDAWVGVREPGQLLPSLAFSGEPNVHIVPIACG